MKLNLGCGPHKLDGYINLDIKPGEHVDKAIDAHSLPYASESVDEIYAGHLIEHLDQPLVFLVECHRVLRPGGRLGIVIPDINLMEHGDIVGMIYGFLQPDENSTRYNLHRSWWSLHTLRAIVEQHGFTYATDITEDDPRLVAPVGWQSGADFIRGEIDPRIAAAACFYRRKYASLAFQPNG